MKHLLEFSLKENQLIVTALKFNGEFAILPIQDFPVVEIENFDLETIEVENIC